MVDYFYEDIEETIEAEGYQPPIDGKSSFNHGRLGCIPATIGLLVISTALTGILLYATNKNKVDKADLVPEDKAVELKVTEEKKLSPDDANLIKKVKIDDKSKLQAGKVALEALQLRAVAK